MNVLKRSPVLGAALFGLLVLPNGASGAQFIHEFGETREYHDHWLRVCPLAINRGCRAVTYTQTREDGFFLEGRLSLEQSAETGELSLQFLDAGPVSASGDANGLKYQFKFSNGEMVNVPMTSTIVQRERLVQDPKAISTLLPLMKRGNWMTISVLNGADKADGAQTYSLIGLTAALDAMEATAKATRNKTAFIDNLTLPGSNWRAREGWPGEYPSGFTVVQTHTRMLRQTPNTSAQKETACTFQKGATYHVWNSARVESQGLRFVSFQEITTFRVNVPTEVTIIGRQADPRRITLAKEAVWNSIHYLAEGIHIAEYEGTSYEADQALFQNSTQIDGPKNPQTQQWMRMTCDDGQTGWLDMESVRKDQRVTAPNVQEYGKASDLNQP
ncbi:MAG: hypothetical protein AAGI12_13665 [Pseudomonadota bacterium]